MWKNVITLFAVVVLMMFKAQARNHAPDGSHEVNGAARGSIAASSDRATKQNQIPDHFEVRQNYPNPFNATTTIAYSLPEEARVCAVVYNVLGYPVKTLKDKVQVAGRHLLEWDGTTYRGQVAASGVYFYLLLADDNYSTGKMLLLK